MVKIPLETYSLFLFDLDDTLCNSEEAYKKGKEAVFKELNAYLKKINRKELSKEEYEKLYQEARKEIHLELKGSASMHNRLLYFQRMIEKLGLQANPTLLYNLEEAYWKEVYKNLKLFPGAKKNC